MKQGIIFAAVVFWSLCALTARPVRALAFHCFQDQYQAASGEQQLAAKNDAEAYEIFSALSSTAASPEMAALAEARAAVALGLQEDRYQEGLRRARQVKARPYRVQAAMELMFARGDYQELVDEFRDEDIAAWPERMMPRRPRTGQQDTRALALFDRGRAFLETGDSPAAERDIDRASDFATADFEITILWFLSRQVYGRLGFPDKAFETNRRIVESGTTSHVTYQAATSAADYLRERERHEEALDILGRFPWRTADWGAGQGWSFRFADIAGRALAGSGDLEAAKDLYRETLGWENISESQRRQAEAALSDLESRDRETGDG